MLIKIWKTSLIPDMYDQTETESINFLVFLGK
jgi:hypothetical protein